MANITQGLLHGMVFETTVESFTGQYLYSDFATGKGEKDTTLNFLVKIPFIGIVAAIVGRIALAIIHTIIHLLAALFTCEKGHLFHAAKGMCEMLRGGIEAIPIIGRIFANQYSSAPAYDHWNEGSRSWWMIKIYNPDKPDGLDHWQDEWEDFPSCYYIKA